ncbi:MAG: nucleotidyltransferase family protein [Candidatus Helarchaeota archaeon]
MDPLLREISNKIIKEMKAELNENLKALVLYGSRIRGDNFPDSDLDLLIIFNRENKKYNKLISHICGILSRKFLIKISPYTILKDDFEYGCKNLFPFNIGVYTGYYTIYGNEFIEKNHEFIFKAIKSGRLTIYQRSKIFFQE